MLSNKVQRLLPKSFRYIIGEFLVKYHTKHDPENFIQKNGRVFLRIDEKRKLILETDQLFKRRTSYIRRNSSAKATISTAIKEESLKIAHYIRGKGIEISIELQHMQ